MHSFPVTRHWMGRNKHGDPVLTITLVGRQIHRFVRRTLPAQTEIAEMGQQILAAPIAVRRRRSDRTHDQVQKHYAAGVTDPVVTIVVVGWRSIHRIAFNMLAWEIEFAEMGRKILGSHRKDIGAEAWQELWASSHGCAQPYDVRLETRDRLMPTTTQPLAEAVRALRHTLYQDGALPQPFEEHDTVEVSVEALHTLLCSVRLAAPPTEIGFAARNIVSQLADLWQVPVDVRQATNDRCDEFTARLIRSTHPSRNAPGQCGDPDCKVFAWGEWPGIDGPVLLCTAHNMPGPGWAYEAVARR